MVSASSSSPCPLPSFLPLLRCVGVKISGMICLGFGFGFGLGLGIGLGLGLGLGLRLGLGLGLGLPPRIATGCSTGTGAAPGT